MEKDLVCYRPNGKTIESDRLVVSNIHRNGLPPVEAGAHISNLVEKMLYYKASGIALSELEKKKLVK